MHTCLFVHIYFNKLAITLHRAPDGTCLLSCSEDKRMRLHNLPAELYSGVVDGLSEVVSLYSYLVRSSISSFPALQLFSCTLGEHGDNAYNYM